METVKQIKEIYKNKGLNGVNYFIKKNNIKCKINIVEFGLKSLKAFYEKSN